MAHKTPPLAYTPDHPIYEDELSAWTIGDLVKVIAGGAVIALVALAVMLAISLVPVPR